MTRFIVGRVIRRWLARRRAIAEFRRAYGKRPIWGMTRVIAEEAGDCVVEIGFNWWQKPASRRHYAVSDDDRERPRELPFDAVEKYGVLPWL